MRKWIKVTFPVLLILALYFLGPAPEPGTYEEALPSVPESPVALEDYIRRKEANHRIKPDNEATIVWRDSTRTRTEYAVVYLHGFSASREEGDPVHRRFAENFGCNLYLPRLADHGVDTTESLMLFTADRAWNSALEALAIGKQLGEKVILMSTSTGGTLALMLAAKFPEHVHALINMSPNIAINNPAAFLLNDPWGLHIARMVKGGKYNVTGASAEKSRYWNAKYRLEAVVQLQELVESSMNRETFSAVTQPVLTLYYYRNDEEQDPEVKVSAMLQMHEQLGTPDALKVAKAVPDAGAHVLGSPLSSNDVEGVYAEIEKFALEKLRLRKAEPQAVSR